MLRQKHKKAAQQHMEIQETRFNDPSTARNMFSRSVDCAATQPLTANNSTTRHQSTDTPPTRSSQQEKQRKFEGIQRTQQEQYTTNALPEAQKADELCSNHFGFFRLSYHCLPPKPKLSLKIMVFLYSLGKK